MERIASRINPNGPEFKQNRGAFGFVRYRNSPS